MSGPFLTKNEKRKTKTKNQNENPERTQNPEHEHKARSERNSETPPRPNPPQQAKDWPDQAREASAAERDALIAEQVAGARARRAQAAYLYFEGDDFEEQAKVLGPDPYPLGLKAMRPTLERGCILVE